MRYLFALLRLAQGRCTASRHDPADIGCPHRVWCIKSPGHFSEHTANAGPAGWRHWS